MTDDDRAVLTRLGLEEDTAVCASVQAGGGTSVFVERLERALAVVLRLAAVVAVGQTWRQAEAAYEAALAAEPPHEGVRTVTSVDAATALYHLRAALAALEEDAP